MYVLKYSNRLDQEQTNLISVVSDLILSGSFLFDKFVSIVKAANFAADFEFLEEFGNKADKRDDDGKNNV